MLTALVEKAATTATATAAAAAAARAAPISCSASVPKLSAPVLSGRSGIGRNGLDGRRRPAGVRQTVRSAEAGDAAALVMRHRRVELARAVCRNVRGRGEEVKAR